VKYTGTKRFGLDGGEAMVPALEQIIKRGGQLGVKEIVIGMAHRGRLNVLANVMAKPHRAIFNEFKGGSFKPDDVEGSGDVKYHLGASSDREFDGNKVHLSLTANPSHLEIVDPVVLGKVRAKQDQHNAPEERDKRSAAVDPRGCGFRGPGCRCRMLRSFRPQGAPHRRLDAFRHQQPDRLYDEPAVLALLAVLHRRRQDDRSADLPRERR
jgi:2-oxoglutarate dehydrogenase E1 component